MRLTREAASMIVDLTQERRLPPGAGLRIAQRDDHDALAMDLVAAPGPDDVVLVEHDATVFLGPIARRRLAGATLDARHGALGPAFFLDL